MREIFSERNEKVSDKDFAALSVGKMGVVPQLETAVKTDNGDNRKLVREGDFAINSRSDRKGAGGISDYDGSVSLIITVLKPHNEINRRFYHYLLRSYYFSEEFYRNGQGLVSDLWSTKWDKMRNIYLPVPPRAEQDQIVRFLDWKVSQIDRLIAGYQKEIALLKERRTTIIDRAVTKGIDPEASYKDSGVSWLPPIPAHWKILKNKRVFRERNEKSSTGEETLLSVSKSYGVKRYNDLKEGERIATIKPAESLVGYKKVSRNDLVMNIMRARNGSYGISSYDGIVSPAYCVYSIKMQMNPIYVHYYMKSAYVVAAFEMYSDGIAEHRRRLYPDAFLALETLVPPLEEQDYIVEYIKKAEIEIKRLEEKIDHQISLLREYRTHLICDAVTGQIDVRDVVIPEGAAAGDVPVFCNDADEGEVGTDADEY